MSENHLVSFSLVFFAVAVFALAGQAQGTDICEKADYPELCQTMVKGATDPAAALKTGIEQLLTETKRVKEASEKMGTNLNSLQSSTEETCAQNFDSAIDDLNRSAESLKSSDKGTLTSSLSGVKTFVVTCDDAVEEGGFTAQLSSRVIKADSILRDMADNLLYLASLLP